MKTKILNLLMMVALAAPLAAHAQTIAAHEGAETGNGGDGVVVDGQTYLLDFVEAGIERVPFFDLGSIAASNDLVRLQRPLGGLMTRSGIEPTLELVARKIAEVRVADAVLAEGLLAAIEAFDWRLVSIDLIDVQDESTYLSVPRSRIVQLAIRGQRTIRVSQTRWEQSIRRFSNEQRAGLIMHEAAYALITPRLIGTVDGVAVYRQSSQKTRELNGYLFTADLGRAGAEGLYRIIDHNQWPTARSVARAGHIPRYHVNEQLGFIAHDPVVLVPVGGLSTMLLASETVMSYALTPIMILSDVQWREICHADGARRSFRLESMAHTSKFESEEFWDGSEMRGRVALRARTDFVSNDFLIFGRDPVTGPNCRVAFRQARNQVVTAWRGHYAGFATDDDYL